MLYRYQFEINGIVRCRVYRQSPRVTTKYFRFESIVHKLSSLEYDLFLNIFFTNQVGYLSISVADPGFLKRGGGRDNGASKAKHKCIVFFWKKGGACAPHAPP